MTFHPIKHPNYGHSLCGPRWSGAEMTVQQTKMFINGEPGERCEQCQPLQNNQYGGGSEGQPKDCYGEIVITPLLIVYKHERYKLCAQPCWNAIYSRIFFKA